MVSIRKAVQDQFCTLFIFLVGHPIPAHAWIVDLALSAPMFDLRVHNSCTGRMEFLLVYILKHSSNCNSRLVMVAKDVRAPILILYCTACIVYYVTFTCACILQWVSLSVVNTLQINSIFCKEIKNCHETYTNKYKNQLNKLGKEVGMAVTKSTRTRIAGMITYKWTSLHVHLSSSHR